MTEPDTPDGPAAPTSDRPVLVSVADGIATIQINRPPMNALNSEVQQLLLEAAQRCDSDDVAAVVLTGGPKVFAAGVDIKEMANLDHVGMIKASRLLVHSFTAVARIPVPVVAAVAGYGLGGGWELALCADIRIAGESATMGQPEVKLGLIPGAGGTQRLPRLIGPSRAKELIFTGRLVGAAEALHWGMVDRVVPDDQVIPAATEWARQFVGGPSVALRFAKEAIDRGAEVDLDTGLEIERQHFASLFATEDRAAGMKSFLTEGPGKAKFRGR